MINGMHVCNLGSGQKYLDGATNVDINADHGHKVDLIADVTQKLPFEDGQFDVVIAEHIAEHIKMHELLGVLQEWARILKPGGRLIICVPEVRELAKAYIEGRIDHYIFCVNVYGPYNGHDTDTHRWGYDRADLERILREVPFSTVQPFQGGFNVAMDWWINSLEAVK